jgi:metal-responsive CopG/Arc/MetJ family transcriptional regulator
MMSGVKRVQLDLPEKAYLRLQDLKAKTEASSHAEVIKNALRLYEAIIAEADAGNQFLIQQADGRIKEYAIF